MTFIEIMWNNNIDLEKEPNIPEEGPEDKNEYEQTRDKLITGLTSRLHDKWRENRKHQPDGTFEPGLKETQDEAWIESHNGQTTVDIANTPYDKLPSDWQGENKFSAEVALSKIEDVLYLLHDKWLDRNFESASPEQKMQ